MNPTIATILGTATLGFIKSRMGSGLRLKVIYWSWSESGMIIPSTDEDKVLTLIKDLEPMMNENGIFLDSLKSYPESDSEVVIFFRIKKLVKSDNELRRIRMWYDDEYLEGGRFAFWAEGDASKELENFCWQNLIPKVERVTTISDWEGDYADEGYERLIVNAETGEEYNPPQQKKSILRKR